MRRLLSALSFFAGLAVATFLAVPAYAGSKGCDPSEIGRDGPIVDHNRVLKGDDGVNYRCLDGVWHLA